MNDGPTRYVLDANVFMEAARRYYAFDIAPGFWQALVQQGQMGMVHSIDRVKTELDRNKDELATWAYESFHLWFVSTGEQGVIDAYQTAMNWAQSQSQFTDAAKAEFASTANADAWLVAYSLAKGYVLVTCEQFARDAKARIPLPNVCKALGVLYVDTFQMLRALGVKLG